MTGSEEKRDWMAEAAAYVDAYNWEIMAGGDRDWPTTDRNPDPKWVEIQEGWDSVYDTFLSLVPGEIKKGRLVEISPISLSAKPNTGKNANF